MEADVKQNRFKNLSSANFLLTIGCIFILVGFILAHLSNANIIHWSYGLEKIAHVIFHIIGPIILLLGFMRVLLEKLKK